MYELDRLVSVIHIGSIVIANVAKQSQGGEVVGLKTHN
jgi:hypothetical protein